MFEVTVQIHPADLERIRAAAELTRLNLPDFLNLSAHIHARTIIKDFADDPMIQNGYKQ